MVASTSRKVCGVIHLKAIILLEIFDVMTVATYGEKQNITSYFLGDKMVMQFSDEKVRRHLMEKGFVYTFRIRKRKRVGKNWASEGRGKPKFADIYITFVKPAVLLSDLNPYVENSGFNSIGEWIGAVTRVNPVFSDKGYLYLVTLLNKSFVTPLTEGVVVAGSSEGGSLNFFGVT